MIISHEHRYVFVQVPDSASTAMGRELCALYDGEEIGAKHDHLVTLHAATDGRYRDYFAFGTIRHPLEIMVARYFKLKVDRGGMFTNPEFWVENGGHITERQRERYQFIQEKDADFPSYFLRFAPRLYESPYFTGLLDRFDLVLRKESLDRDFRAALARLGIQAQRDIPPANVTPARKGPFADYYTPEIRERTVASFGPYMRRWGFAFPEAWGARRPPRAAMLEYELGLRVARFGLCRLGWSPERALAVRDRVRSRVRKAARRAGSA